MTIPQQVHVTYRDLTEQFYISMFTVPAQEKSSYQCPRCPTLNVTDILKETEEDYSLPPRWQCTCYTLNLVATRDIEDALTQSESFKINKQVPGITEKATQVHTGFRHQHRQARLTAESFQSDNIRTRTPLTMSWRA